ncbi:MAG: P-loop domain-containing protein, partial [Microcoleaceae cyanobacterium]
RSTTEFTTENASGSTSQAANIMEVLEVGLVTEAQTNDPPQPPLIKGENDHSQPALNSGETFPVLLVDEDTAASNFMIRDRRMQELISKDKEPITPFIDKVRQLYLDYGVSTILVMGGSGDYFDVADTVISMENFQAFNVTEEAKEIANNYISNRTVEGGEAFGKITPRIPIPSSLDPSRGRQDVRLKVRDMDEVTFGTEEIDVTAVEQIVDKAQLRAIVSAMVYGKQKYMDGKKTLREIIDHVMADIEHQGMDILSPFREGDFAMFRPLELAAAINRLRTLSVITSNGGNREG